MTYRLRPDGRQFVVIAAGGHGTMGTTLGDELLAFRCLMSARAAACGSPPARCSAAQSGSLAPSTPGSMR